MTSFLVLFLIGAGWPPVAAAVFWCLPPRSLGFLAMVMIGAFGGLLVDAAIGNWGGACGSAAALLAAYALWRWRRRRKRAPRSYGAKSRALLAALVRRMRETTRPRPVLRPAPQGAS